jgi:hypothetical protein
MKYLPLTWLAYLLMCSCQSNYEVGLKSQVEVANARKVAVCQSGDLDQVSVGYPTGLQLLSTHSKTVVLPKSYTAHAVVKALSPETKGTVIQGLALPRFPANRVVAPFRNADYVEGYDSITPVEDFDLVIHVCQRAATPSTGSMGGYYNPAAGAYIPMGGPVSGARGYLGNYVPLRRAFTFVSMLDVYVYRGTDGKCLGNFYFSYQTMIKKDDDLIAFKEHVDATAQRIVLRIFGH